MYYTELRSYASKLSRSRARRESGFRRLYQVLYLYIQGHFDYPYYASQASLPEGTSSLRLIYHFLDTGRFQLLNPNHLFDTGFYISAYLDVARSGVDPYLHFLREGWRHGRRPCAVFDGFDFLEKAGIAPGRNPVQVYASKRLADLGPFFDKAFYLTSNTDVRDSQTDPVYHYLRHGRKEGRQPNAWINPAFYNEIYGLNKDALEDYQIFGDLLERDPSPGFDGEGYNARQCLQKDRCFSALEHYLGQSSIVGPPAPSQIFLRQQRAEALINKKTRGVLALESFRDLLSTNDGYLEIVSGDPQLVFRWVDDCDLTELVALSLTARSANPKEPVNPQLFVDYGTGWTESASAIMEPAGEDRWLAYIPFPRAVFKVRLDVSSVPMTMRLLNINCEPFAKDALSKPMPAAWHDWMLNIIYAPSSGRSVHDELAATYVKLNPRRTYVSRYQYQEWIRCHPLSAAAAARQSKFPVAKTPETLSRS